MYLLLNDQSSNCVPNLSKIELSNNQRLSYSDFDIENLKAVCIFALTGSGLLQFHDLSGSIMHPCTNFQQQSDNPQLSY